MYDELRSLAYRFSRGRTRLPGLWERVGDSFAGCGVLIEKKSHGLRGRITYVPPEMRHYGWQVGDVKWQGFVAGGLLAYRVQELYKEIDRNTGKIKNAGFMEARIGFIGPNEMVVFPRGLGGVQNTRWYRSGMMAADVSASNLPSTW